MSEIFIEQQKVEDPIAEKDMARKLNVCRDKLAQLRREKVIPFIRTGRRVFYQPSEVIDALKVLPNPKAQ